MLSAQLWLSGVSDPNARSPLTNPSRRLFRFDVPSAASRRSTTARVNFGFAIDPMLALLALLFLRIHFGRLDRSNSLVELVQFIVRNFIPIRLGRGFRLKGFEPSSRPRFGFDIHLVSVVFALAERSRIHSPRITNPFVLLEVPRFL